MLNIKEIAPKLTQKLSIAINDDEAVEFAEALIAEIAKQNKPCAFLHEWFEYHPFGDTVVGEPFATITNDEKPFDSSDTVSPLFTFPPTAEQIANETAEACARVIAEQYGDNELGAVMIRSGEWKEFKKS